MISTALIMNNMTTTITFAKLFVSTPFLTNLSSLIFVMIGTMFINPHARNTRSVDPSFSLSQIYASFMIAIVTYTMSDIIPPVSTRSPVSIGIFTPTISSRNMRSE